MSYLEYNVTTVPTGLRKLLYFNWGLAILLTAAAGFGFLMLYSVAGGDIDRWAKPQMVRFGIGMAAMLVIAMVPIWFWRNMAGLAYVVALVLLIGVDQFGETGKGAQRWIDLGFLRLQPSEIMKIALVMMLAAYYDWLDIRKVSHPLWVLVPLAIILVPAFLVLRQPDLGTAILLVMGGGIVMFAAGVSLWYFGGVIAAGIALVTTVLASRGTSWQLLKDYQFLRIDTFLDPSSAPQGAGYHITQAKIAMGSGGWTGRGFMQGTQSRLNFLPEKHTDFIFNTLAEEFGFIGGVSLLAVYALIILFCISSALNNKDRFGALVTLGLAGTFFLFFAVNMSMVMGLAPVVGVPLPLVSYGGTAMLILLLGFGIVQSAHVHRPRTRA
ncbi:rod shape-determining protein RodA [Frigidibacter sp. ROC022]|uniref:rod shape-determining protein RodA n=1 Tax=Frigidibacter sp. ROC022 TaxID=2971796 RepID=UPI00215AECEC|nr:rod shape-determining protein RodA [Frigidibacter sp. ROC022]MCR8726617.1 rod shape-determining protein RodA [Frigidibacter sp. ROC022]